MNDLEVDSEERPTHPPKILSAEVLSSPFDDIIPRDLPKKKQEAEKKTDDRPEIRKTKYVQLTFNNCI
jgi:peptidyl-prolyl cis-trans isomerase SDCCAG10